MSSERVQSDVKGARFLAVTQNVQDLLGDAWATFGVSMNHFLDGNGGSFFALDLDLLTTFSSDFAFIE